MHFSNANGCDSLVRVNLTVNPPITTVIDTTVCYGSFYSDGNYYPGAYYYWYYGGYYMVVPGTYTATLKASNGICDSLVVVHLNIVHDTIVLNRTICPNSSYNNDDGYYFGSINNPGTYYTTVYIPNNTVAPCNTIIRLNLSIAQPAISANTNVNATICAGTNYNDGNIYYNASNGSYVGTDISTQGMYVSYQNLSGGTSGCENATSTTLNLSVTPALTGSSSAAICAGGYFYDGNFYYDAPNASYYWWYGYYIYQAGTYHKVVKTVNNCDSIVTLTLTVNPLITTNVDTTICANGFYWNGQNIYTAAGTYNATFRTATGCDSLVISNVTVSQTNNPHQTITAVICAGNTYSDGNHYYDLNNIGWIGSNTLNSSGIYTASISTGNGCDSIITLILTYSTPLNEVIHKQACGGR